MARKYFGVMNMTLDEAKDMICREAGLEKYQLLGSNPLNVLSAAREVVERRRAEQMKNAGSLREKFADAYYHSMGEERPEVVAYRQGMAAIDKAAEGMGIYDPGYIPNRWQA